MRFVNLRLFGAGLLMVGGLFLIQPVASEASSSYINLDIPGAARDVGAGKIKIEGGFNVHNNTGHYWNAATGYSKVDLASGVVTSMGKPENINSNMGGDPFGLYDPASNSFYGATFAGSDASYVYKYDYASNTWADPIRSVNIYSGAMSSGELYISGLRKPWSGGYDDNYISLFDWSGEGYHDALIDTGGASASVALDKQGNVYYANYNPAGGTELFRWSARQVDGVKNDLAGGAVDTFLTLADGEKLSDLPGGGNGITVDDAGHVFVTTNSMSEGKSRLMMWNGVAGEGDNFDLIASNPDGSFAWFGPMSIEGDFTKGDSLYGSFGWNGPITEITSAVPLPGALWLMGSGLLGLVGVRRRRN
ncbi:MAG: VPLPA-CTERM sorting domain-containing protein [Desulfobacterium sp.]|nr:VPLPA-CTERM sorting domain-containing protein [Desulfobacterium sp.]